MTARRRKQPEKQPKPSPRTYSVLPMDLRVGDRFADEAGEWQIVSQPYTTGGGKFVHARVSKVGEPAVVEARAWGAHEMVAVRRG